jgi:murein DD-endopeptidase MepM/ murein hydrolase activator NlpD
MRYKEFVTKEAIDRAVSAMLGRDVAGSYSDPSSDLSNLSNKEVDNTVPNSSSEKTSTSSKGEILPVKGPISSPFGRRASGMHLGTDFAVPTGTPVVAPQDGTILKTGQDNMNGIYVHMQSGNTVHWLLHLSQVKVSAGETVKQGQVVALSGNTGHSTGPHLHWSKRIAGQTVDPMANVG